MRFSVEVVAPSAKAGDEEALPAAIIRVTLPKRYPVASM